MNRPHPLRKIRDYWVWLALEPGMPYADIPFTRGRRAYKQAR